MTDEQSKAAYQQTKAAYRKMVSSVFEAGPVETDGANKHAPLPWRVNGNAIWSDAGYVAELSCPRGPDARDVDAAFIVEAVNNYESLRAQLAIAREALEPFVAHFEKEEARYKQRGGDPAFFGDDHPSFGTDEDTFSLGVWRKARAALSPGERK